MKVQGGIINFPIFNVNIDKAMTYRQVFNLCGKNEYGLVVLEADGRIHTNLEELQQIQARTRVAIICASDNKHEDEVELARSNGFTIISPVEELIDVLQDLSGITVLTRNIQSEDSSETTSDTEEYEVDRVESVKDIEQTGDVTSTSSVIFEEEDDTEEQEDSSDTQIESVQADIHDTGDKVEELQEKLGEIASITAEREHELLAQIEGLRGIITELENNTIKIDEHNAKVGEATEKSDTLAKQTEELKSSLEDGEGKLRDALETVENLKGVLNEKEFELEGLRSKLQGMEDELRSSGEEATRLSGELCNIQNDITGMEASAGSILEGILVGVQISHLLGEGVLESSMTWFERLILKIRVLGTENINMKGALEAITADRDSLADTCEKQAASLQQLREENGRMSNELQDVDNKILNERQQLEQEWQGKLSEASQALTQVNNYLAKISNLELIGRQREEFIKTQEKSIEGLQQQILSMGDSSENASRALEEANTRNDGLQHENESLKQALSGHSNVGIDTDLNLVYNYSGKAKIILCTGSGSYGTTTIAMTAAHRCSGYKALFIDMDFVAPKADAWFKIKPFSDGMEDIKNPMDRTATSALIHKGVSYLLGRLNLAILNKVDQAGKTVLDYMPGVYRSFDESKLYGVDFTTLLNKLGEMYDYIIIDIGRMGSCRAYDTVIRSMASVAHKIAVTTLNDPFDTRSTSIKLEGLGIDRSKVVWILNLSETNKLDKMVDASVKGAKVFVVTKVLQLYGTRTLLHTVPLVKGTAMEIVQELLK